MSLTCSKNALFLVLQRNYEAAKKAIKIDGDAHYLDLIMDNLNAFALAGNAKFNIVEP